jgi:hypothetical protein
VLSPVSCLSSEVYDSLFCKSNSGSFEIKR